MPRARAHADIHARRYTRADAHAHARTQTPDARTRTRTCTHARACIRCPCTYGHVRQVLLRDERQRTDKAAKETDVLLQKVLKLQRETDDEARWLGLG